MTLCTSALRATAFASLWMFSCSASPAQTAQNEGQIVEELSNVGARITDALRRRDINDVLEYVASYGISCGDLVIPRDRVVRELATRGTRPNAYLFDAAAFEAKYRSVVAAVSLAQVVESNRRVEMRVVFSPGVKGKDLGSPCIEFGPSGLASRPWLCFIKDKKGKWVLIDSLYDC